MTPSLSVIVPTRERSAQLVDAVRSIAPQVKADGAAELLVVDSASADGTAGALAALRAEFPRLRALRCEGPGLLAARHRGAAEARGGVLVFVDDDVLAPPGWLAAWREVFADPAVALAGGPALPAWEAEPPWWVELFRLAAPGGWTIWPLSLVDCGPAPRAVPPGCVYGCNLGVRRGALAAARGFHPDSVPRELTACRGDGESALADAVARGGGLVRYHPGAGVRHRVPRGRLTRGYFLWRAFCQGVSESYAALRRRAGLEPPAPPAAAAPPAALPARARRALADLGRRGPRRWLAGRRLLAAFEAERRAGRAWHAAAVAGDPDLRAWVLRPDYLADAALPAIPAPVLPSRHRPASGRGGGP